VVSIAESLNYRIFERKWRPGEALNGLTRACRILSVEQKPNPTKEPWFVESATSLRRPSGYPESPSKRRFMGNSIFLGQASNWKNMDTGRQKPLLISSFWGLEQQTQVCSKQQKLSLLLQT